MQEIDVRGIVSGVISQSVTVKELESILRKIYCGSVGAEINHIGVRN